MRFMMMAIHRIGSRSDREGFLTTEWRASAAPDGAPCPEAVARMTEYDTSLRKAGVLLARDVLFLPSSGTRISCTDGKATVTGRPFAESNDAVGSYWIIQVRSREEAIEWAKRAPMSNDEAIEIRQIREMSDFPEDVLKAAEVFSERTR